MIFPFNIIIPYNEYIVNCFDTMYDNFVQFLSHFSHVMTNFVLSLSHLHKFCPILHFLLFCYDKFCPQFVTSSQILSPVCHIFVPCDKICDKFIKLFGQTIRQNAICHIFLSFVPSLSQVCHVNKRHHINVWGDFTLKCDKFSKIANKMKNRKINLY